MTTPIATDPMLTLPTRPRLKRHLRVAFLEPDRTLLLGEGRQFLLSGQTHACVIRLLDGKRSTDEIVDELLGDFSATDIYYSLLTLQKHGHLEEADDRLSDRTAAYWSALGFDAGTAAKRLGEADVQPLSVGEVPVSEAVDVLRKAGISSRPPLSCDEVVAELERGVRPPRCLFVVADEYLRPALGDLNRATLATGTPWLLVQPTSIMPLVGPLFVPRETGCWTCLAQRVRANREVEIFAHTSSPDAPWWPSPAGLETTSALALDLAGTELARWLIAGGAGQDSPLRGKLLSLDMNRLALEEHVLTARPQCESCGRAGRSEPQPIVLQYRHMVTNKDGGYRSEPPEATLVRLRRHVSPITGIARGLTRSTRIEDPLIHVYVTGQNLALRSSSLRQLRHLIRGGSCGKGVTDTQAQVSGIAEAIERYSGVFRGEEPRLSSSLSRLGDRGIDPRTSMLYSEAQYKDRDRWNEKELGMDKIPFPFDEDAEMEWSPVWSLTREEFRHLPTSYLYYSYPVPDDAYQCFSDSNGCAAGTSLEDAVLQGFLELIERDAVALWWYNRVNRPGVDLESVDHPYVVPLRDRYAELGRDLWVLDLTNDLGVPVFVALSHRVDGRDEAIIFAPAAHLDPEVALLRALAELNQMLPGIEPVVGDHGATWDDPAAHSWWANTTVANQPYLLPDEATPPTTLDSWSSVESGDLRAAVEYLQKLVEGQGLEVLVLDQTRPDIGVPVVKVIVPGLRHFWARFAPGRLFDVPVSLGWQPQPTPEEALNPIPIFI